MAKYSTNSLLDLCRFGISTRNEQVDTAARELASYIVFASLLSYETNLPVELEERVVLLRDAVIDVEQAAGKYLQDMFDEEPEQPAVDAPAPTDDGPQVA